MATRKKSVSDINRQTLRIRGKLVKRYLGETEYFIKLSGAEQRKRMEDFKNASERIGEIANGYINNIRRSKRVEEATRNVRGKMKGAGNGSYYGSLVRDERSIADNTPVSREVYMGKMTNKAAVAANIG